MVLVADNESHECDASGCFLGDKRHCSWQCDTAKIITDTDNSETVYTKDNNFTTTDHQTATNHTATTTVHKTTTNHTKASVL